MVLEIEKNIPVRKRGRPAELLPVLMRLKIGESVLWPGVPHINRAFYEERTGHKLSASRESGGIRIWRVK